MTPSAERHEVGLLEFEVGLGVERDEVVRVEPAVPCPFSAAREALAVRLQVGPPEPRPVARPATALRYPAVELMGKAPGKVYRQSPNEVSHWFLVLLVPGWNSRPAN